MPESLIIASNRLPVTLTKTDLARSSGGLVTALEGLANDRYDMNWVGWLGQDVADDQRDKISSELRERHGCIPVFLSKEIADAHYEGLSNSSIWPLLHYLPSYFRYQSDWWEAYKLANQQFAEVILANVKDGQMVWVHDYQLMLLPRLLKQKNPTLRIGFFLHTPFPSSEVFRCHPNREALLDGMLGADLCGFHTFAYLRQFRSTATNVLGTMAEITAVRHNGALTRLGVYPIGIPAKRFETTLASPAFLERLSQLGKEHQGKKVVLSVERLDYTKGILPRLDAIELFLSRLDETQRNAMRFMFVAIPTRGGIDAYQQLRQSMETRVGAINGKFASLHNSPIHFIHGSVEFSELCALYALADVALVTPLRDGLNLVAKEYVACQREVTTTLPTSAPNTSSDSEAVRASPGVLILSEFAGAAEELFNALVVNPHDVQAVASALEQALAMSAIERRRRMIPMTRRVMRYDASVWAEEFLTELSQPAPPAVAPLILSSKEQLATAQQSIREAIEQRAAVAMFLDYDGTLREITADTSNAQPSPRLDALLSQLANLECATITLISGRSSSDLELFLGKFSRFNLVGEHGAVLRRAGETKWDRLDQNLSYDWKEKILKILIPFERSTPGSNIENRAASLVWHYRRSDMEFGEWKARKLVEGLSSLASDDPIEVRHGRQIVEVVSTHVNKASAVVHLLQQQHYKLIVMAGDDVTDESLFGLELPNVNAVTLRVGFGETRAKYRVADPAALRAMLLASLPAAQAVNSTSGK